MTEQVRDRVVYQESEYILDVADGDGLFDPSDLGVRPARTSTANWRRFRCTYAVVESRLVLDELRIGLGEPNELHLREPKFFAAEPERAGMQSWLFKDLQYPIGFTGQLTLVKDWITGFFSPSSGIRPLFTYGSVLELRFQDGLLLAVNDRSDEMRQARDSRQSRRSEDE
jgi:hypothetical protein